jgi:hypothetical protein
MADHGAAYKAVPLAWQWSRGHRIVPRAACQSGLAKADRFY